MGAGLGIPIITKTVKCITGAVGGRVLRRESLWARIHRQV